MSFWRGAKTTNPLQSYENAIANFYFDDFKVNKKF